MTGERDPFERELAERLTELADTPLAGSKAPDVVAAAAMTSSGARWRLATLGAVAAAALVVTSFVLSSPPESAGNGPASGSGVGSPSSAGSPQPTSREAQSLVYTCGDGFTFSPALFDEPELDLGSSPPGAALDAFIHGAAAEPMVPKSGWHLVGKTASEAFFIAAPMSAHEQTVYPQAQLDFKNGGWRVGGYGGCQPELAREGLGAATFRLAEHQQLGPSSRSFDTLVLERGCASAQSSQDRLRPPLIIYEPERIILAFTVVPMEGGVECPSNPESTYHVELAEPIGHRAIVDAGLLPWSVVRASSAAPTPAPSSSGLESADADEPTAGACAGPLSGDVVTVELRNDIAAPGCVRVVPTQRLRIVNRRNEDVTVHLAGRTFAIPGGGAEVVSPDLGTVWEPGVHIVTATAKSGRIRFEVWLVSER